MGRLRLGQLTLLLVLATGCGRDNPRVETPDAGELTVVPNTQTSFVGQQFSIDVRFRPPGGAERSLIGDPELALSSSDPTGLTVVPSEGLAVSGAAGDYQIRALFRGQSATASVEVLQGTLERLRVEPAGPLAVALGADVPLRVTGVLTTGVEVDLTEGRTGTRYSASGPQIQVSPDGRVSAVQVGDAEVVVENDEVAASVSFQVQSLPDDVERLRVDPAPVILERNEVRSVLVFGVRSDGSEVVLPQTVLETSLVRRTGVVRLQGLRLTAQGQLGEDVMRVRYFEVVTEVDVRVVRPDPEVASLVVTPRQLEVRSGEVAPLRVVALFVNGTERDVTSDSGTVYRSDAPGVAEVDDQGRVTGVSPGFAEIVVRFGGQEDAAEVQVEAGDPVTRLVVEPNPIALEVGQTVDLDAVAEFADGTELDVSRQVSLRPVAGGALQLTDGVLEGSAQGAGTAVFEFGGVQASVPYAVVQDLSSVQLRFEPDPIRVEVGESVEFQLFAEVPGLGSFEITTLPSVTYVPTMDFDVSPGSVRGLAAGRGELVAILPEGIEARVNVVVLQVGGFDSLRISAPPEIPRNRAFPIAVVGIRSDGTGELLNGDPSLTVQTSPSTVLSLQSSGPNLRIVGQTDGRAELTAFTGANLTASAEIRVRGGVDPVVGLQVAPDQLELAVGQQVELQAEAVTDRGTSFEPRGRDGLFAVAADGAVRVLGGQGRIALQGQTPGNTVVSVFYDGLRVPVLVEVVQGPPIVGLQFALASRAEAGETLEPELFGITADGRRLDLSSDPRVAYTVSDPTVLRFVNGVFEALAAGTVTVEAQFGMLTAQARVVVEDTRVPELLRLVPSAIAIGMTAEDITVVGRNLRGTDVWRADGTELSVVGTNGTTEVELRIPASLRQSPGEVDITAEAPAGRSNALELRVGEPPSVDEFFPGTVVVGGTTRVRVLGSGLDNGLRVTATPSTVTTSNLTSSGTVASVDVEPSQSGGVRLAFSNDFGPGFNLSVQTRNAPATDLIVRPSGTPPRRSGVVLVRDLTIEANATLLGTGTQPLVLLVTGDATIDGIIDVSGQGPPTGNTRGGVAGPGGGGGGGPSRSVGGDGAPSGGNGASSMMGNVGPGGGNGGGQGAGEGAASVSFPCGAGGGGGGAHGAGITGAGSNQPGAGGTAGGRSDYGGGTGGGGGHQCVLTQDRSGGGGGGGGVLEIQLVNGGDLTLGATGQLLATGGNGGDGEAFTGSGGGGSGGTIRLFTDGGQITVSNGGRIDVSGGDGGNTTRFGNDGGGGGGGRIDIDATASGTARVPAGATVIRGGVGPGPAQRAGAGTSRVNP